MAKTTAFGRKIWQPGEYTSPEVVVPVGATSCVVGFGRDAWPVRAGVPPDNEVVRCFVSMSFDDGVTWGEIAGAGCVGGDILDSVGAVLLESQLSFSLPDETNSLRKLRGRMVVVERARIEITVDIT